MRQRSTARLAKAGFKTTENMADVVCTILTDFQSCLNIDWGRSQLRGRIWTFWSSVNIMGFVTRDEIISAEKEIWIVYPSPVGLSRRVEPCELESHCARIVIS